MSQYDLIKYPKNFLNQVIARLDFANFVETASIFDAQTEQAIRDVYPRREMDQIIRFIRCVLVNLFATFRSENIYIALASMGVK